MFVAYCLVLLLLVYLAPALALYPKLILSSRTVVAIHFISIGIIAIAQGMLAATDSYSHLIVTGFSIALLLTAAARLTLMFKRRNTLVLYWPDTHRLLLLFSLLLGIYWAAQLGSTGFDNDDEIYSWNMWAIQHYQNEPIDFYYTGKYPQLFSILISYCYKLLGNIELHLPIKAMFAIFPIALWGAIAVAPKEASITNALRSIVIMLLLFAAVGQFFGVGLADPLMASSLVVGIFLFIQYTDNPEQRELLVLSVACAAVAFYTKQGALIWALFSLPAITLIATTKRKLPPATLLGAGVLLALALIWVFGVGNGFQHNGGVITASQEGRSTFEQLLFAIKKHCTEQPLVPVFIVAAVLSILKARSHRDILILFLLPALIAWLLYGAYDLRLGIHLIALSALLIAASNYPLPAWLGGGKLPAKGEQWMQRSAIIFIVIASLLATYAAVYRVNKNMKLYGNQFSLDMSGKNTIAKFFGSGGDFVYTELYDKPNLLLWVPVNYIYGIFYGHIPMMRPDLRKFPNYDAAMLLADIKLHRPNYLFDGGQWVDYSIASGVLRELAEQKCTYLFEKVGKRNKYGYVIYRLQNDDALLEQCANTLQPHPIIAP
jgi:hypothetical protein